MSRMMGLLRVLTTYVDSGSGDATFAGVATAAGFAPTATTATGNRLYLPAANTLGFAINGAGEVQLTGTALSPVTSDGNALGTTSLMWSDLFLASGAVVNFNNGDVTITHAADNLAMAGGTLTMGTNGGTNGQITFCRLHQRHGGGAGCGGGGHRHHLPASSRQRHQHHVLQTDGNGCDLVGSGRFASADSLDFDDFTDTMALDASTSITADGTEVLSIVNTGTGNSFLVEDEASTDATPFVINASGQVGIGTTTPVSLLHLEAAADAAGRIISVNNTAATGSNTTFGGLSLGSGPGTDFVIGKLNVDNASYLQIQTVDDGLARLTMDSSGNVGIGSATPAVELDVVGAVSISTSLLVGLDITTSADGNIYAGGYTGDNSVSDNSFAFIDDADTGMYNPASNELGFSTGSSERMRIDASGNVGIGSDTPAVELDVVGAVTATGVATATGFAPTASTATGNRLYLPAANTLGLAINGAGEVQLTGTALSPVTTDGNALGTTSLMWSDLFLASGAVVNFNNGDVTITHAADNLAIAGGTLTMGTQWRHERADHLRRFHQRHGGGACCGGGGHRHDLPVARR